MPGHQITQHVNLVLQCRGDFRIALRKPLGKMRDSLLDLTQGRNAGSFERSIDVLVSRIRRKIETDPQDSSMIKTVRSGGYLFTPTVEPAAAAVDGAK